MAQAGDFVINMLLATAQFDNALKASGGKIRKTADQTERQMRRVRKSGFTAAQGPTELSRGLQDLALVTSMGGGLSRGLQSTANNFGEMLTRIHPLAGLAVGVGLAFGGPLLENVLNLNEGISETEQKLNGLTLALERLEQAGKSAARAAKFGFDIADIGSADAARSALRARSREQAQLRARREALEAQQAEITKRFGIAAVDPLTREVSFGSDPRRPSRTDVQSRVLKSITSGGGPLGALRELNKVRKELEELGPSARQRFEDLGGFFDDSAQQKIIDRFLKIQQELEQVARASSDAESEGVKLNSRLRELEEREKKAAAATEAEKQQKELTAKQDKLEQQALAAQERELQKREEARRREIERGVRQNETLAAQIIEQTRTPLEALRERLFQIEQLAEVDRLDEETARRAVAQAAERAQSLLAADKRPSRPTAPQFARALAFGSAEGFDAIARAIGGTKAAEHAKQTATAAKQLLTVQEEAASTLERIRDELKGSGRPITVTGG